MADVTRDPRPYELMAVFIPDLSDEDFAAEIARVSGFITDQNATISEVLTDNPWGRRRLAYTMRFNGVDYRDGIYAVFHFDSNPAVVTEIERELKLDTNLIRYLLVHDDPLAGEKSQPVDTRVAEGEEEAEAAPEGEATEEAEAAPASEETAAEETSAEDEPAAPEGDAPAEEAAESATDDTSGSEAPTTEE